jgi:hypothetical protein
MVLTQENATKIGIMHREIVLPSGSAGIGFRQTVDYGEA